MLEGLNKEQREAVESTEGLVRVIAGAGTGKTRALTHRYVYLNKEKGIPTSKILSVTFTNKATGEMRERIRSMIGPDVPTPSILTFHSFGNRFLREYIGYMDFSENFKIMDTTDQKSMLKGVYDELEISSKDYPYNATINKIIGEGCKTGERYYIPKYEYLMTNTSIEGLQIMMDTASSIEEKILLGYLKGQKRDNSLDYDDLINYTLHILRENAGVRAEYNRRYDYIQVDEFQDVSLRELEIVALMSEEKGNLFVVGDTDQTIYTWRGADVSCLMDFGEVVSKVHRKTREVKTVFLVQNYRSNKNIISVSNSLIEHNQIREPKELIAHKEGNIEVVYHQAKSIYREADWVVENIKKLLEKGKTYEDIAIVYRNNQNSRAIEEKLITSEMPYEILSGISFYQRKEIKDILAVLSLAEYGDNPSFVRVVGNFSLGIGKKKVEYLEEKSKKGTISLYKVLEQNIEEKQLKGSKGKMLIELVNYIKDSNGKRPLEHIIDQVIETFKIKEYYEKRDEIERYDNIIELKDSTRRFKSEQEKAGYYDGDYVTVGEFLNTLSLYSEADKEVEGGKIKLMTVHASKGLEFPVVFLIMMSEGTMPSSRARTIEDMEEERRVAYVAITRAEEYLFLSSGGGYNYNNEEMLPSRFILNIKEELLKIDGEIDPYTMERAREYIEQSESRLKRAGSGVGFAGTCQETVEYKKEYKVGDKVNHLIKGNGVVLKKVDQGYIIAFDNGSIEGIKYESEYLK